MALCLLFSFFLWSRGFTKEKKVDGGGLEGTVNGLYVFLLNAWRISPSTVLDGVFFFYIAGVFFDGFFFI